jgi:nitrilase
MKSVRAAVVQNSAVVFNREATLEKAARLVKDAKREGAELVLFPEAFVSAYPKGLDFGAVIGSRTAEGREDFRRYFESAIDVRSCFRRLRARALLSPALEIWELPKSCAKRCLCRGS